MDEDTQEIQDIIWDVTDGFGLTHAKMAEFREKLKQYR